MAGEGEIKVDIKAFITAAEEVGNAQKQIAQAFDRYVSEINTIRNAWQGDTSDKIKAIANSMKTSGATINTNLSAYIKTLNELAGIYDAHEKSAEEQSKTLGFDANSMK